LKSLAALIGAIVGATSYYLCFYLGRRVPSLPFELASGASAAIAIGLVLVARKRAIAAACGLAAALSFGGFELYLHTLSWRLPPAPAQLAVGTIAPDFTLPDETGRPLTLSSLRGQPLLLVFYRGDW
jgi:hypothetical protein